MPTSGISDRCCPRDEARRLYFEEATWNGFRRHCFHAAYQGGSFLGADAGRAPLEPLVCQSSS